MTTSLTNHPGTIKIVSLAGLIISLALPETIAAREQCRWSVFAYGGKWSDNSIAEIVRFTTRFENSWVWAAGISRRVHDVADGLLAEAEVNIARHTGLQEHFELNMAVNLRWHRFPWDDYINTSISYGLGPSYAFSKPPIEQHPDRKHTHAHIFMPVEITFGPPERLQQSWETMLRVHHRSGAFGVVNDATGSNFIVGGLRHGF